MPGVRGGCSVTQPTFAVQVRHRRAAQTFAGGGPAGAIRSGRREPNCGAIMPIASKYILVVSMDIPADKEALFNEIYDHDHIPHLKKVPGVGAVTRARGEPFAFAMAGVVKNVEHTGARYTAIYEIDDPKVLTSAAWAKAVEAGRWPAEVRPFATNRSHAVFKVR